MVEAWSEVKRIRQRLNGSGDVCGWLLLMLGGVLSLTGAAAAQLQNTPTTFAGTTAVGSSSQPVTLTVTAQTAGTISSLVALTGGMPNLDFVAAPITCTQNTYLTAGETCLVSVTFSPLYPGVRQGAVLIESGTGLLGAAPLSGIGSGGLPVLVPGEINTVAGDAQWTYQADGVPATEAPVFLPTGLTVDAAGELFLCDSSNNRVRYVDTAGIIHTVAGNGIAGSSGDGHAAIDAELSNPSGLALDGAGNLYIADTGNQVIRRVDAVTKIITTVAGQIGHSGYAGDGSSATEALLTAPQGLTLTPGGDLVIADTGNNVVRELVAGSGEIVTIAGTGVAGYNGDGIAATQAQLSSPSGVAVREDGAVAIADTANNRVRLVATSGSVTTVAGTGEGTYGGDGQPAVEAQLYKPGSVAFDPAGDLVIADSGNNRVRGVYGTPATIMTLAGNDSQQFTGDDGPANQASLYGPSAVFFDSTGNIWVSDFFHNRVREIAGSLLGITYPVMKVGKLSVPVTGTLYNGGNTTLTLNVPTVLQAQLDAATTTCDQSPMAPTTFCNMGIDFAPTQVGGNITGSVTWTSNAPNVNPVDALNGEVLSVEPTTVALTSSANPGLLGQPVTLTATVSSDDTGRTGTVSFSEGSNVWCSDVTLSSDGSASCFIASLSLGSHIFSASYSGDENNAASTSSPYTEVIKQAPALALAVSTASSPAVVGGVISLSLSAADQSGTPTGTVIFYDGATAISSAVPLVSAANSAGVATATWSTSALSAGPHALSAQYSGDGANAPETSNTVNEEIAQPSNTALVSASPTSLVGKPATFTATVTSATTLPAGTVTFEDGNKVFGTATLSSNGVASLSVSTLTLGTHTITAIYGGDSSDLPSSAALQQNVALAQPTLTLSGPAGATDAGASSQVIAALTTPGIAPTGTLTLLDGGGAYGTLTVNASGSFPFSTSKLAIGTHTLTASYSGDANNAAVTSTAIIVVVQQAGSTTTLISSANPLTVDGAIMLSATVASVSPNPGGQMSFYDGATLLGTVSLGATGSASFSPSNLGQGVHTLTAVYMGDTDHAGSTSPAVPELVVARSSATLLSSNNPSSSGQNVTFVAQVLGPGAVAATGTVSLRDNGALLASVPLNSSGAASFTTNALAVGSHTVTASYSGDNNFAVATAQLIQTVADASTQVTLTGSANPATYAQPFVFTATVTSNGGTASGAVSFTNGGATIGSAQLNESGFAVLTLSTLSPGAHVVVANYLGDGKASASVSTPLAFAVKQTTALAVSSNSNPAQTLAAVNLTATLSNAGAATASGRVSFADGGTALGTAQLGSNGQATLTVPQMSAGTHSITAEYPGDGANFASTSGTYSQAVQLRPTAVTVTGSSTDPTNPQQITLIAVVKGQGSVPPSGNVNFTSGNLALGEATVDDTGVATITVIFEQPSQAIVASYSGDVSYATSQSSSTTIAAGQAAQFTLATNAPSITLVTHQHATLNVSLSSVKGFTDTIALGCLGLPFAGTCTFTPSLVKLPPNGTATASLVVDTGDPLGAGTGTTASLRKGGGTLLCCLPVGMLLGLLRRNRKGVVGQRVSTLLVVVVSVAAAMNVAGCSGLSTSGTPPGTYSFKIVGTGQGSGTTQAQTITLVVTQ